MPAPLNKEERFAAFYEEHYNRIYRYVRGRKFPYNHTGDIVSKIFMLCWQRFDEYLAGGDFYWVLRIAENACKYQLRKFKRQAEIQVAENDKLDNLRRLVDGPSGPGDSATELKLIRNEQWTEFLDITSELPEKQRSVVHLRLEGFTFLEIATALEISEEAARRRLLRALENLKEPLAAFLKKHPEWLGQGRQLN